MTYTAFLENLLSKDLTMNEMTILLELAQDDFTRDDLLNNPCRCPIGTYAASALSKTLKRLMDKNPAIITNYLKSDSKIAYRLLEKCEKNTNASYDVILKSLRYSRVLSVNSMRVGFALLINNNKPSTARFLANQLNLEPDYLASTVLPRMLTIGLAEPKLFESPNSDVNYTSADAFPLHAVSLDLNWKGTSDITLL